MIVQFRGRFELKVDPKFRLSLPSAFREVIGGAKDSRIIITNSQIQGKRCLDAYTFEEWQKLERKTARLPQLKVEVQNFQRFYLSGGHLVELDAQSRCLIPPSLRNYAAIQSDVVVVGFAQKFEIWSVEAWNSLFEGLAQGFESTLAVIADLEKPSTDE
jgi:MraZ protein